MLFPKAFLMNIKSVATHNIHDLRNENGWLNASLGKFHCFFGRDAAITSLELIKLYPEVAKFTLLKLMQTQGKEYNEKREEERGKIVHEDRVIKDEVYEALVANGWDFPYYGTVDATILYVILAEKYLHYTRDTNTIASLISSIEEALIWIKNHQNNFLFVTTQRMNPNGISNQNWKDSFDSLSYKDGSLPSYPVAYIEVQGLQYEMIHHLDILLPYFSDEGKMLFDYFKGIEKQLQENIHNCFFMPEENFYAAAIDKDFNKFSIITSNPGYLLYTGVVDQEHALMIRNRLFQNDMMTSFGLRTLSTGEKMFNPHSYHNGSIWPHDNWIFYEGLRRYGFEKDAHEIKNKLSRAIKDLGHIPELYCVSKEGRIFEYSEACKVQAWSAGALLSMIKDDKKGIHIEKIPLKGLYSFAERYRSKALVEIKKLTRQANIQ